MLVLHELQHDRKKNSAHPEFIEGANERFIELLTCYYFLAASFDELRTNDFIFCYSCFCL
jgi:hypothetical protein